MAFSNQSAGTALCTLRSATPADRNRWVKIEIFDQERAFCFELLRQGSPSRIFYLFWGHHDRKLRISLFDRRATKLVKFPNFSPGESTLHRNSRQWSRKFPSRMFYSFWPPYRQKFRIGLFDRGATKWVKFPNFPQFSAVGRTKWVKNCGGKLSRPLA